MSLPRLLRTVRHLKAQQIVGQLRHRLQRHWENPARFARRHQASSFPGTNWSNDVSPLPPFNNQSPDDLLQGQWTFLNQTEQIGFPPNWSAGSSLLWQFNLHYFEPIWLLDFSQAKQLVQNWIEQYPLQPKQVGWLAYPTCLRLDNWCAFFFGRHRTAMQGDTAFCQQIWASIALQMDWLTKHLETHLLGNHYLENAVTLTLVGSCFAGDHAKRWYQTGLHILRNQLPKQILSDGGHFERSPMYHCRVLYALLLLQSVGAINDVFADRWIGPMRWALSNMCHPFEVMALLNDSAFDIYPHAGDLLDSELAMGVFSLPDTGYYGARTQTGHYIICDSGPVGPNHLLGHAHADVFNFELTLAGKPIIVDSGNHDYDISAMRHYCRSTQAHNTVQLDGQDQCELWGSFRVGRRPGVESVEFNICPAPGDTPGDAHRGEGGGCGGGFQLGAQHAGYRHLKGKPVHHRQFRWHDTGVLMIRDQIRSSANHTITSRLHLHPDVSVEATYENGVTLNTQAGPVVIALTQERANDAAPGTLDIQQDWYCPRFGQKIANKTLVYQTQGSEVSLGWVIAPGKKAMLNLQTGATIDGNHYEWNV